MKAHPIRVRKDWKWKVDLEWLFLKQNFLSLYVLWNSDEFDMNAQNLVRTVFFAGFSGNIQSIVALEVEFTNTCMQYCSKIEESSISGECYFLAAPVCYLSIAKNKQCFNSADNFRMHNGESICVYMATGHTKETPTYSFFCAFLPFFPAWSLNWDESHVTMTPSPLIRKNLIMLLTDRFNNKMEIHSFARRKSHAPDLDSIFLSKSNVNVILLYVVTDDDNTHCGARLHSFLDKASILCSMLICPKQIWTRKRSFHAHTKQRFLYKRNN